MSRNRQLKAALRGTTSILLATSLATSVAYASPYDAFVMRPGDTITNSIVAEYDNALGFRKSVSAQNTFAVQAFPANGVLKTYRFSPNAGSSSARSVSPSALKTDLYFPGSDYATSASSLTTFIPMGNPSQQTEFGPNGIIDLSAPITVEETTRFHNGSVVFFSYAHDGMNLDEATQDRIIVMLEDTASGDVEKVRMYETGADTGLFTGYIEIHDASSTHHDGSLSTRSLSEVELSFEDPYGARDEHTIEFIVGPIDPTGRLFDSVTGAPINGAQVTIIDTSTGLPATVLGDDLESIFPATITTGEIITDASGKIYDLEDGGYRFPFVSPGTYTFEITPPVGYAVPSSVRTIDLQTLPGAPYRITEGSRGESFEISVGVEADIDIPADRIDLLSVSRTADRDQADIGDLIQYSVTAISGATLEADLIERLSPGMRLLPGSVHINGHTPQVNETSQGHVFHINDIPLQAGTPTVVKYTVAVTPGTLSRTDHTTSSELTAFGASATDDHSVKIKEPFGLDDLTVIGSVSVGGCDEPQSNSDLSGIRIFTETGDYAVTDRSGRYIIEGLSARQHVVQIDELSLPFGYEPTLCEDTTATAGNSISQFIDGRSGGIAQAHFSIQLDSEENTSQARVSSLQKNKDASAKSEWEVPGFYENLPSRPLILSPVEGHLPQGSYVDLQFVRPAGQIATIYINEARIDALYRERTSPKDGARLYHEEWRGIPIPRGKSVMRVDFHNRNGKLASSETRNIYFTNKVGQMDVLEEESLLVTNGRSEPEVVLQLRSREGYLVHPGTVVSIQVDNPFSFALDGSGSATNRRGSQLKRAIVGEDGKVRMKLASARSAGRAEFKIQSSAGDITTSTFISAKDRPWLIVGIAEGSWAEKTIRRHMQRPGDFSDTYGGRVGLFAEGIIAGKYLTTLQIDTAQIGGTSSTSIDEDASYIVYSDRSTQSSSVATQFPLYLRIEGPQGSGLIGDYDLSFDNSMLGSTRNLTGAQMTLEKESFKAVAFVAEANGDNFTETFPSNGTVGPFRLERTASANSIRVTLITLDKENQSRQIASKKLFEGTDYIFDSARSQVFLRAPISAFDSDLNRQAIRVDYTTEDELRKGILYGAKVSIEPNATIKMGAGFIHDENLGGTRASSNAAESHIIVTPSEDKEIRLEAVGVRKNVDAKAHNSAGARAAYTIDQNTSQLQAFAEIKRGDIQPASRSAHDELQMSAGAQGYQKIKDGPEAGASVNKRPSGTYLEYNLRHDQNITEDEYENSGDVLLSFDRQSRAFGFGLRVESEGADTFGSSFLAKTTWASKNEKLEFSLTQSMHLAGYDHGHTTTSTVTYALSERTKLIGNLDSIAKDGSWAHATSFGVEQAAWSGAKVTGGLVHAQAQSDQSIGGYFGLRQDFDLTENSEIYFGYDAQRNFQGDLGASFQSDGGSLSADRLDAAFQTLSFGYDLDRENWGAGLALDHTRSEGDTTSNARVRASGNIDENRQISLDYKFTREGYSNTQPNFNNSLKAAMSWREDAGRVFTQVLSKASGEKSDETDNLSLMFSAYHGQDLTADWSGYGRIGVKRTWVNLDNATLSSDYGMLGAGVRYDVTSKVTFGLHGSLRAQAPSGTALHSVGASVGVSPVKNSLIEAGYNFKGYEDTDFSESGWTDSGFYIQFNLKFDQNSFK